MFVHEINRKRPQKKKKKKKKGVVCSYRTVSVWEIGPPPRTWSDTRPKNSMSTSFKHHIEWQYFHTISFCSNKKKKKKMQPWSLATCVSTFQRCKLWWPLVFSGPNSSRHTEKNTSGQTIGKSKIWSQCQSEVFSFHFEDKTLVSMPRVLNE